MTLDIKAEAKALREMYASTASQQKSNFLLLGESGSGKTQCLSTAPRPIHIFSFDPGGTKTQAVQKGIKEGWITVETKYEVEDYKNPTAWRDIVSRMQKLELSDFFKMLGTVAIDSYTFCAEAHMNFLCRGKKPEFDEWDKFLKGNIDFVRSWCNLPCYTVLTCHLSCDKDDMSGRIESSLLVSGQSAKKIPPLVDEMYIMRPQETASGIKYQMQIQTNSRYNAASRLKTENMPKEFQGPFVEPNLTKLLEAAGIKVEHKPNL